MNSSHFQNIHQSVAYSQFINTKTGDAPAGADLAYDPRFQTFYYVNKRNSANNIFISRTSWSLFERKQFHPALMAFALTFEEFNTVVDGLEKKVSKFFWIRFWYTIMVVTFLAGICCFLTGAYVMPDLGEKDKEITEENQLSDIFFFLGTGICILSILLFSIIIKILLSIYTKKLTKALVEINGAGKAKGIFWRIGKSCKSLEIEFFKGNQKK